MTKKKPKITFSITHYDDDTLSIVSECSFVKDIDITVHVIAALIANEMVKGTMPDEVAEVIKKITYAFTSGEIVNIATQKAIAQANKMIKEKGETQHGN